MQEEMKLQDYIRLSGQKIWKEKILIIAITLLALLVGILQASWQTVSNTYCAKTTIYTVLSTESSLEAKSMSSVLTGYSDILKSKKVCERAEALVGNANVTARDIQRMLSVSYNKESTVMTISAVSTSPTIAIKVANAVSEAFVTEAQSLTGSDKIQILDQAENVALTSNGMQGLLKSVVMYGVAGFALSILVIVMGVIFSTKIRSVEQCLDEGELEILGIIPYVDENK